MERLWAPWRMSYISGIDKEEHECVFCALPAEDNDRENLILFRGEHCFVLLNRFPYNNGHAMVVPYRHTADLGDLDEATGGELWRLGHRTTEILRSEFRAEGFNLGINIGRLAGAGIDQHLHLHVVPRWNGDTSYMPVTTDMKVISQSLEDAYDSLAPHFQSTGES